MLAARARCDDMGMNADERVIDDQAESRFELMVDGAVAELVYRRRADRLVLVHTEVPESARAATASAGCSSRRPSTGRPARA